MDLPYKTVKDPGSTLNFERIKNAVDTLEAGGGGGGGAPSGPAGGDLSGTYPDPQIAAGAIVNADVNGSAAIAYAKLALTNQILNGDINAAAAIAYSKLNLAGAVTDADLAGSIAQSKITNLVSDLALKAPLASPTLTGTPAAPTAAPGTNTTQLATTAFATAATALKADLASPALTGDPTAPTATAGDNDTSIATTAFVTGANATASTADRNRANHTGTQLASTISDFNTAVRTNRLDQMAAPTANVAMGANKITGLNAGTASSDAATKGQVDACQPLDSDLTAIAAVASQTAFGRGLLALADAAAGRIAFDAVSTADLTTASTADRARANHTGTQLASTISDFNTAVRTNRLDQMATPTAAVAMGSQKITSVADGTSSNDAVNVAQLDFAKQGFSFKIPCQYISKVTALSGYTRSGNVLTKTSNGPLGTDNATNPLNTERVLVVNAISAVDAGIYTVTQRGDAFTPWVMTRAPDALDGSLASGAYTTVLYATASFTPEDYYLATPDPIVVNTTAQTWTKVTAPGQPRCRATRTAALTITTATDTLVTLPTEDVDTDAFHDITTTTNTSRLTIPTGMSGTYMVTGNVVWALPAAGVRVSLFLKNGTSTAEGSSIAGVAGVETRQSFSEMMQLVATDYIEIRVRQSSGVNVNVNRASLQLVKIG